MTKPISTLRLGALPKVVMTKVTFACSTALLEELQRYADLHARIHGVPVNVAELIPHMLVTFMARDRAFKRSRPALPTGRPTVGILESPVKAPAAAAPPPVAPGR